MTSSAPYWYHKVQAKTKQSLWCVFENSYAHNNINITFWQQLSSQNYITSVEVTMT